MANTSRRGFWPVGTLTGASWSAGVRQFNVAAGASNIWLGDMVVVDANGQANVVPEVSGGANVLGAVVGFKSFTEQDLSGTLVLGGNSEVQLGQKHSSGAGTVLVSTDPLTIYEAEVDAAAASQEANIGQTCNIDLNSGSNTTGLSGQHINGLTMGTSAAGMFKVVGTVNRIDNEKGVANGKILVVLNGDSIFSPGAGI